MNNPENQSEVIIILPKGESRKLAMDFVGRAILYGFDFYFEPGDKLPETLPKRIKGVKAIIFDDTSAINENDLSDYKQKGARVYKLKSEYDISRPTERRYWELGWLQDMIAMDANITMDHSAFTEKMQSRCDRFIYESLLKNLVTHVETRWCEPARHQWEGMLDDYELTGNNKSFELMQSQVKTAMKVENEPDNCDSVAPILPVLRLYEISGDDKLLEKTKQAADGYIENAPRYKGCFVGFHWLDNHARAEIIFQVCPSLIYLYKVTGKEKYLNVVLDQYERYEKFLKDPETGLWFHGAGEQYKTAVYWSRGVAFVFMGILMIAEHIPNSQPLKKNMIDTLKTMADKLRAVQNKKGLWHKNVFNKNTRLESSGTAWLGANFERAMRLGILDDSYRNCCNKAWTGLKTRIFMGRNPGIVGATTVSPDSAYYLNLPINPLGNWSHFAFRFACERRRNGLL